MTEHLEPCPIRTAIGLLNSMVCSGEAHSAISKQIVADALTALDTRTSAPIPDEAELVEIVQSAIVGGNGLLGTNYTRMTQAAIAALRPYIHADQSARVKELEADLKQSRNDALDEAYFVCTERRDMLDDMDDVNCCAGTAKVCAADIEALKSGEEG